METIKLIIDERLESIISKHSDSELVGLRQSIEARGILEPIIVWGKIIWDGIARYRIAVELDIDFEVKYVEFKNLAKAAQERICHHKFRRQVNPTNRIDAALNLFEGELCEQAKANQINGARKGGLAKVDADDPETEADNKIWVNSIIAQLSESNDAYVSFIRNLRKKVENNDAKAKTMLFKLRRGDISISSAIKFSKTKATTPKAKTSKSKAKTAQTSLIEQYDADKWGMEFALKEMNYEKLKDRYGEIEQQENIIDPNAVSEKVAEYCEEGNLYGLVATLVPLLEISYRIGFIKGSMEQSEDGIRAEFSNREFQIHSQLRQWMQYQDEENEVKANADEENDSVE